MLHTFNRVASLSQTFAAELGLPVGARTVVAGKLVIRECRWARPAQAILALTLGLAVAAATHAAPRDDGPQAGTERAQRLNIPDAPVTDQDGRRVRFLSDVVRQRPAVVSFIFTGCSSTCPLVGATMAAVADRLRTDKLDSALVSISVDPENDTPAALTSWRAQFGNIPQWTLLTGSKSDVDRLLRAFRSYFADPDDHPDILMIGPDATGTWTRMSAPAPANDVVSAIRAAVK
jgi:protein SCO1